MPSAAFSARDLPQHTKLKFRQPGQNTREELDVRDLKAELERKEQEHFQKVRAEKDKERGVLGGCHGFINCGSHSLKLLPSCSDWR